MAKVLLRRSALGDVVLLGSVTKALGDATVVTSAALVPLARRLIGVREAVAWPELPRGELVDLQGSLATRWLAPWADRVHKRSLRRRLRLWGAPLQPRPTVPELYAEAVGVTPLPPPWIDVPHVPRDVLALAPGAAWAPKRPRAELLVAAGRAWPGPVVVLGGPGEEGAVAAITEQIAGAEGVCERGFERTLEVLARARVALTGDSGLMHLAGACGAAVVALFGPTHPADGFFVYRGVALGRELPCRPCALHRVETCRRGDLACADHDVERVLAEVRACAG